MTAARAIAAFAADLRWEALPAGVQAAALLHLTDALGVGLAAAAGPGQAGWPDALGGPGAATCLSGPTAAPAEAALLNGALIHALEYDDTHVGSVVHGSAVAAPVALAMAEARGGSGAALLAAYVVAWEVMIRIGLAAPGLFQARGLQVTAVAGALGAAAAAGRARGLDAAGIAQALGIAGTQASGLLAFLQDGASVKALNPGWAAHTGILAANLAAAGMTGPAAICEGPGGVMQVFAGGAGDLEGQLASLGRVWHLPDAAFKLYPCCHYIHPFLEATQALMAQGLGAQTVTSILLEVAPGQAPLICEPWGRRQSPLSGHDGRWGLAYCVAHMLLRDRVEVASFEAPPDPDVVALARRIVWRPMPDADFPARFPARVTATTAGGRTLTAEVANVQGAPGRPVPEARVREKFRANAARRLPPEGVARLAGALDGLARAPDLSALTAALRGVAVSSTVDS